jgi:hypothetical protein
MDLISSGNETTAHTLENGRITFMFCSFDEKPAILRLYGRGRAVLPGTPEWERYASHFTIFPSTRQLIIATIDLVQISCGFGVPQYTYTGKRDIHFGLLWEPYDSIKRGKCSGLDKKYSPENRVLRGVVFSNSVRLIGLVQAAVLSLDRTL